MNTKMWLAPVLAVTLALLLAGAISPFLPQSQASHLVATPTPSPSSTYPPMPAQSAADLYFLPLFFMCAVALVIVGIAIVLLFFRDKPRGTE